MYEMFGIKRRLHFNGVRLDPLGSRSPPYECIKFGYPVQNVRFLLLSSSLARERLQIDTDLLHIITSTADELSGGTSIDDLEPQNRGFSDFFRDLWLPHTFQGWTASKSLEIDQDNLETIFSALNVDFNSASFHPLGSRIPYERVKCAFPLENVRFLLLSTTLARERLQIHTDVLRIITRTADELSGGTNIDDLERPWTPKYGF